jgi:hypothetical protein
MIHIRAKALGALVAVLALGAAIAVPSFAMAEGEAESTPPAPAAESTTGTSVTVEPLAEEACPYGDVCVWPQFGYQGTRGLTECSNTGEHFFGNVKNSLKNRCPNQKVWWYEAGGGPYRCVNPNENAEVMDQEYIEVGAVGSRC